MLKLLPLLMVAIFAVVATEASDDDSPKYTAGELLRDLHRLKGQRVEEPATLREPVIKDSHIGHDLHKDFFYFNDKVVDVAYKRTEYLKKTRITLAGQAPDLTQRLVPAAQNPFGVGQKCVSQFGSSLDRWDVKENSHGHQFLALYNGQKGSFVVNKLRAILLTRLVNELDPYLSHLDITAANEEVSKQLMGHISDIITEIFRDVDKTIREQQYDKDETSASATLAIVTKHFIVATSLGKGRVVAHDALGRTSALTEDCSYTNQDVFGLKKDKPAGYRVNLKVNILPRIVSDPDEDDEDDDKESYEIQLLLLETPSVAKLMEDKEATGIVLSEIKNLRGDMKKEQDIYSRSVDHILQAVASKINMFNRMGNPDHSVVLVGLQRDYNQIH